MNHSGYIPEEPDTTRIESSLYWEDYFVFGSWPLQTVLEAVNDDNWQLTRMSMKGTSLRYKWKVLRMYLYENYNDLAKIRVTNYIYALKRGGLIK